MPRTLTITAVALLAAMGLPVPASADHVACGDTITQDTKLDSDLICAGDGLTVTGSGVTLDLAGHTISGLGTGAGVDVRRAGTSGESIRRGTIRGFGTGVYVDASGAAVERLAITDNVYGLAIGTGFDVLVRHNVIADNSGPGLHALDSGRVRVAGNDVLRNGLDGIHFGGEVFSSVAEKNVVSGNGDDGIEVFENDPGEVDGVPDPERVNAVARNLATDNGDLGIEAVAGTVDGGGNRAFGNGNPLQCLNVECR